MKKGRNRWVKVVALIIVAALIVGVIATSLFVLLSGSKSVAGTYRAGDGRTLTLTKNGTAKLTVPSTNQVLNATYEVDGDVVKISDPSAGPDSTISFRVVGDSLVIGTGGASESWTKQ